MSVTSSPAFGASPDQPIDRPQRAAESAMLRLVDMTTPKLRTREQSRSQRTLLGFAFQEAARYQDWTEHTWQIDGAPIKARTFAWAGAWAGFAIVNDVAVVIHAVDFLPDRVSLTRWQDTRQYHFDVQRPLHYPETMTESYAAALGTGDDAWRDWSRHPDYDRLVADPPNPRRQTDAAVPGTVRWRRVSRYEFFVIHAIAVLRSAATAILRRAHRPPRETF